ncbi:MAG: sialidase family protein [Planctomycetota bacterium]|nr:sialidase family protein [Planctomycetota bacterium]MDA1180300.1 sialidase family protein [Planctomycetota bacterium]
MPNRVRGSLTQCVALTPFLLIACAWEIQFPHVCLSAATPAVLQVEERYIAVDNVCAWPNLTLLPDGSIVALIFNQPSHGRLTGDIDCWGSTDGGRIWSKRGTAVPHDRADTNRMNIAAGLAHNGDLVVICSGWQLNGTELVRRLPPWVCRSSDGGHVWSVDRDSRTCVRFPEGADYDDHGERMIKPFGDIVQLPNGRLAASFYHDYGQVWMFFSADDGRTWGDAALISGKNRCETAHIRLTPQRWIAASRTEMGVDGKIPEVGLGLFASSDEGRTWQFEQSVTNHLQHPGDLLRLADGRVLLAYGMRDTFAIGVRFGDVEGRHWSPPAVLVQLNKGDMGYPSTVQLGDGTLVTAFYHKGTPEHSRYHMGVVRWRPPGVDR